MGRVILFTLDWLCLFYFRLDWNVFFGFGLAFVGDFAFGFGFGFRLDWRLCILFELGFGRGSLRFGFGGGSFLDFSFWLAWVGRRLPFKRGEN